MIRLLIAVLLFASFHVVAEVTLTEISNDEVADADEVMGNFNALKQGVEANATAIDALPAPPTDCTADQIIKWDDTANAWVCATDPFAGLNCTVGDQLRMGSSGWECRAEPITASLSQNNWALLPGFQPISAYFDSISNVDPDSFCTETTCFVLVIGVSDHTSCNVQVTGSGSADVTIDTFPGEFVIDRIENLNEGQAVYISISCTS